MTKNHLKRNAASKKWKLLRKENKFVVRAFPGKHSLEDAIPLTWFLKQVGLAETTREAKKLLLLNNVQVDKKRIKASKCPVGFMDVISINDKNFRCVFDNKGRIDFIEIEAKESIHKICKILNKSKIKKGKIQLNLSDGRNILVEKDEFKTGDSLVLDLPSQKIVKHLPFKENVAVLLMGGKNAGKIGKIQKITEKHILYKDEKNNESSTLKDYAFVIGKEKSEIKIQ